MTLLTAAPHLLRDVVLFHARYDPIYYHYHRRRLDFCQLQSVFHRRKRFHLRIHIMRRATNLWERNSSSELHDCHECKLNRCVSQRHTHPCCFCLDTDKPCCRGRSDHGPSPHHYNGDDDDGVAPVYSVLHDMLERRHDSRDYDTNDFSEHGLDVADYRHDVGTRQYNVDHHR